MPIDEYEAIWKAFPGRKTKAVRDRKLPKIVKEHGQEAVIQAVRNYAREVKGTELRYIMNEGTWWNGRYLDYLHMEEQPTEDGRKRYKIHFTTHEI